MKTTQTFYARVCDVTNEGMNEGWVFGDGEGYFKYEKDALEWAIANGYADLDEAYEDDAIYWTEWEDDFAYVEIDGVLTEIDN